jgi:hypothetical protein
MLKTQAEIARMKGVSRKAVNFFISKHTITPAGKKGKLETFDTAAEPMASYISGKRRQTKGGAVKPTSPKSASPAPSVPALETPDPPPDSRPESKTPPDQVKITKPLNDLLKGRIPDGQKPSAAFYMKAMLIAEQNKDAAMLFKLGQIADKEDRDEILQSQMLLTERAKEQIAQEKAERLKIENDIRRGMYMDRDTVKMVFGRFYAVHTSQLQPLGLKLADTIDSIKPGPDRHFKIQKLIDDEIFSALQSIQRLMKDWTKTA